MEKNLNKLNTISYAGIVNVKVMDGKRTLKNYQYHNAGKQKLFEFLANCLIGNFSAARSSIPCRLACFNADDEKVSTYVYCDSSRYKITENKNGAEVVFRFRIPYTCLKGGKTINCFALFPEVPTNATKDRCAEFKLKTGDPKYPPIEIPTSGGNFTIVVEWKMTLKDVSADADTNSSNAATTTTTTTNTNNI